MVLFVIKLSAEVSAVLRSELTKYFPLLSIWDLLVSFQITLFLFVLSSFK